MRAFYATEISEHISQTPEGFLVCRSIPIARDGVQIYKAAELGIPGIPDADKIKVLRPSQEVFSDATIASFEGKPFVSPHPPTFITAENISGYQKGHIQNVREGSPLPNGTRILVADVVVTDATLISQILAKTMRELSCGYDCTYEPVSDEYDPAVQFAQKNIRGNHLALVPTGRAGESIRILDSQTDVKEGGLTMEIKAFKEAMSDFKDVLSFLGIRSPSEAAAAASSATVDAKTVDADPGAVERNSEKNAEALERAKMRNKDGELPEALKKANEEKEEKKEGKDEGGGGKKEEEKESAGATKPKEAADAGTNDAISRKLDAVLDALLADRKARDEEKEAEKKKEEEKKAESEDSELIPVATLPEKEVPENPIPGAPAHVDAAVKDALLAIKPAVAAAFKADPHKFRDAAAEWNTAWRAACGKKATGDGAYRTIATDLKKSDKVLASEGSHVFDATAEADSSDYAENMRQFHRQPIGSVKTEKARVQ